MTERPVCVLCGNADPRDLRESLVDVARQMHRLGRPHAGPDYVHAHRCRDREACRVRAARHEEPA